MKNKLLALVFALALCACQTAPPINGPDFGGKFKEACLPEASAMASGLAKAGIESHVLMIRYHQAADNAPHQHAGCAYMYPPGQNMLWVWDESYQSIRVRQLKSNPVAIGRDWFNHWSLAGQTFVTAWYLDDEAAAENQ